MVLLVTSPGVASADAALAQALFDEGKRLMDAGNAAAACPKFEASYAEDQKAGTQFQLANCLEVSGKTASAWANFLEVAGKAKSRGEAERERVARERARVVEQKLTKLRVIVTGAETTAALQVRRDGKALTPASWGVPVAVDPGTITLEAGAPGYASWKSVVEVTGAGVTVTVTVPALTRSEGPISQEVPATTKEPEREGFPAWGIVGGVVGALALGGAIGVGIEHANAVADLSSRCPDGTCTGLSAEDTTALRSRWDSSLVGTVALAGVAAVGTGVLVAGLVVGSGKKRVAGLPARTLRTLFFSPGLSVSPGVAFGTLTGRF